jgi:hypothetical protein
MANDSEDDIEVARRMKELSSTPNKLQMLIQQNDLFKMSKFARIDKPTDLGFPSLTEKEIKDKITLGSYQIEQARGYIQEHASNKGDIELLLAIERIQPSISIVCCRFHSRHKSQTSYKSFLQLDSTKSGHESVAGWYCDCKSGSRTVGCCSHIASILVFCCLDKFIVKPKHFDFTVAVKDTRSASKHNTQNSLKRDLSFYSQSQVISQPKKGTPESIESIEQSEFSVAASSYRTRSQRSHLLDQFTLRVPKWGGRCVLNESHSSYQDYKNVRLSNTCSVDYLLLAVWLSKEINPEIPYLITQYKSFPILSSSLLKVIDFIENMKWNEAKSSWLVDIAKINPEKKTINCFGAEARVFGKHVDVMQEFVFVCGTTDCILFNRAIDNARNFFIKRDSNNNVFFPYLNMQCTECNQTQNIRFVHNPPWILVESDVYSGISFTELPKKLFLGGLDFKLLCCTISSNMTPAHFEAIFELENKIYFLDDLAASAVEYLPPKTNTSCSLYIKN